MKIKETAKNFGQIFANSFTGFSDNKVTKLSGSLAYSTIFSIGPLLVVIIALCGIFLGHDAVQNKIYHTLEDFLGKNTAIQLQEVIRQAAVSGKNKIAMVIGFIALLVGATSIFSEIQDSINDIWGIKPKPKKGWLKMLQNRFLSFSIIVGLGFLLVVSLVVTSLIDGFSHKLQVYFASTTVIIFYVINQLLTVCIVSVIFAAIFKVLPDAKIKWRDVVVGALVTTFLFMLGKFGISMYISKSNVGSTYGAMGSLVVLMLWVYYSSIILYFGAEFTKAYAVKYGSEIVPAEYAVTTKQVEVETDSASVQEKEGMAAGSVVKGGK